MSLKDQLFRSAQTDKEKNKIKHEVSNLKKKNETEFLKAKELTKEKITWQISKLSKYNSLDMILKPICRTNYSGWKTWFQETWSPSRETITMSQSMEQ